MPIKEIGRKHGFSDASFYKWRSKYGGMDASEAKPLRELELENGKLKRLLAEAHLDIHALKSVFGIKLVIILIEPGSPTQNVVDDAVTPAPALVSGLDDLRVQLHVERTGLACMA